MKLMIVFVTLFFGYIPNLVSTQAVARMNSTTSSVGSITSSPPLLRCVDGAQSSGGIVKKDKFCKTREEACARADVNIIRGNLDISITIFRCVNQTDCRSPQEKCRELVARALNVAVSSCQAKCCFTDLCNDQPLDQFPTTPSSVLATSRRSTSPTNSANAVRTTRGAKKVVSELVLTMALSSFYFLWS